MPFERRPNPASEQRICAMARILFVFDGRAMATRIKRKKCRLIAEARVIEPELHMPDEMPYADYADRFEPNNPQATDAPRVVEAEVVEPESHVPPDIAAILSRMADLYQELLHNKEQEITALRQALDVTELSAANERRELEMLNRLTKMMERENQRLTAELEDARRQLGQTHPRRGLLARLFGGGEEEASSASHSQV
jgi:hypothetical protein